MILWLDAFVGRDLRLDLGRCRIVEQIRKVCPEVHRGCSAVHPLGSSDQLRLRRRVGSERGARQRHRLGACEALGRPVCQRRLGLGSAECQGERPVLLCLRDFGRHVQHGNRREHCRKDRFFLCSSCLPYSSLERRLSISLLVSSSSRRPPCEGSRRSAFVMKMA